MTMPDPPKGITWTKVYDCGCAASGGLELPDYCSEHGSLYAVEMEHARLLELHDPIKQAFAAAEEDLKEMR